MKKFSFALLIFTSFGLTAQKQTTPVKWKFDLLSKAKDKAEFVATATIEPGWNIYAVYMSDEGPIPTSFTFGSVINGELDGEIVEKSKQIKGFDPLFEMEVIKFKEKAEFSQLVNFVQQNKTHLAGYVTYMACDSQKCLPPVDVPFSVKL